MTENDSRKLSQQRFSQYEENYVTSPVHAVAAELTRLLELANPVREWVVMDLATGGGHTALKFAPHVRHVVAVDFSLPMLRAARRYIATQERDNVFYVGSDAEYLAFPDNTFDLITCRAAAHHFPDIYRFIQECARVLKPGGILAIQDHVLPEDERDSRYIEAFEKLRDPSHHRAFSESEWRGTFLDAGLQVEHVEHARQRDAFLPWAERQGCTPYVIERLQILLAQAPKGVREWLRPACAGTPEASFDHVYILITGRKPE
jgi:ubiquinone/menaquinone biosynthesis C-methylase UbiE